MLIEFSVANFRSFRERQTFSMVAAPRLKKKNNTFSPEANGEKLPDLLKVAAIYGSNASGKSNLIKALETVGSIARRSPSAQPNPLPVQAFRFDKGLADRPSSFELHFVHRGTRYEFELAANPQRIVLERLTAYPKGKEAPLYERRHSPDGDKYEFPFLEGDRQLHDTWRKLTGPQALFISQAVANSSEDFGQLRDPFEWLSRGIVTIGSDMRPWAESVQRLANKNPNIAPKIAAFLQEVDVPVKDIRFESGDEAADRVRNVLASTGVNEEGWPAPNKTRKTTLVHTSALGEAEFDFEEESDGTKGLIGFWLPWVVMGAPGETDQSVFAIDEFDRSLHPVIVATLVKRHIENKDGGQLIFTTHDTHLMDTKLLRRDAFWLTERDFNAATLLRSIHDFEGREGEDIEKRYFEGRYRSLPFVSKG